MKPTFPEYKSHIACAGLPSNTFYHQLHRSKGIDWDKGSRVRTGYSNSVSQIMPLTRKPPTAALASRNKLY